MALQTMCRSTFGILQFKTMRAVPERNIERAERALTYRKPLSHLAFAAKQERLLSMSVHQCVCVHVSVWLHVSAWCVCVNCIHACMGANILIYVPACCAYVCLYRYICVKKMHNMLVCNVCACANYVCVCVCAYFPVPHLSDQRLL